MATGKKGKFKCQLKEIETVNLAETLRLECEVNKPDFSVRWLKDNQPINENNTDGRTKIKEEGCKRTLMIQGVCEDDAGLYACVSSKEKTECTVEVKELPIQFTTPLKEYKVEGPEAVVLKCQLNKPHIPVKWLKDGQEIAIEKRIRLFKDKFEHCLRIEETNAKDSGTYKCVCGDTESQCTVEVTDRRTHSSSISGGRTPRSSISDERIPNNKFLIALALCAVLLSWLTTYFFNTLNNTSHIFEKEQLELRLGDIDKAIKAMQTHQEADERSLTEMVQKYTKEKQIQDTELQSLKSKLQGVENDVSMKADKTKLEDLGSEIDSKFTEIEEEFRKRTKKMEQVLNEKIKEFKNSLNELENDLNDTKVSSELLKQETNQRISSIWTTLSDMNTFLDHDFKNKLNEVFEQMNAIKEAKKEADEILEHIKGDLRKIIPNTFNKEALTTAFLTLTVIVFCLAFWIYRVQARLATGGPVPNRSMNAADVLQQIPTRVTLGNSVCIISFDEARQAAHEALVSSAFLTVQNVPVENFVVRRHEHLLRLPKCKFYIMCTEFSERHVIIEEPGLGLGDLKRCTYETIQRYGAQIVILYTRDPGSRKLGGNLYNPKIHCVSSQPELSRLRDLGRFLSTYDELTENQKQSLNGTIAQCLQ